jgi:outer membrane lipoprotein SlyB
MRGNWIRVLVPLLLAAGLGACASNAVQPGIVYSSGVPQGSTYGNSPSGAGPYGSGPYGATRVSGPGQPGGQVQQASAPAQGSYYGGGAGDPGRVVSIREVPISGPGGGGGGGNGAFMGGLLGAGAGATIGAITSQSLGGGIVGAVLGMVGGAIAGTIADGHRGSGRGIEVTVQRDDGQQVTVAQRDDGDIQLGDRVQIVQNRQGVAQVVRDNARNPDPSGTFQPTQ